MSIDRTRAQIVVSRGNDAAYMVLQVPRDVVGFNTIREGSTVRGRFEEIVVLRLEPRAQRTAVGGKRAEPVTLTRTMAGIITKVDVKAPSVTFTGPNGWSYSWPVINRAVLEGVKVGDEVDVTFASGVLTSIECFIRCRESK
jgi:hypothetical protein